MGILAAHHKAKKPLYPQHDGFRALNCYTDKKLILGSLIEIIDFYYCFPSLHYSQEWNIGQWVLFMNDVRFYKLASFGMQNLMYLLFHIQVFWCEISVFGEVTMLLSCPVHKPVM
jgi:hypothetical protein